MHFLSLSLLALVPLVLSSPTPANVVPRSGPSSTPCTPTYSCPTYPISSYTLYSYTGEIYCEYIDFGQGLSAECIYQDGILNTTLSVPADNVCPSTIEPTNDCPTRKRGVARSKVDTREWKDGAAMRGLVAVQ